MGSDRWGVVSQSGPETLSGGCVPAGGGGEWRGMGEARGDLQGWGTSNTLHCSLLRWEEGLEG